MKSKHKNCLNEQKAKVWLLEKGFEVFENISSHGSIDLIIQDENFNTFFLDVKAPLIRKDGTVYKSYRKTDEQLQRSVKFLWVLPDGFELE